MATIDLKNTVPFVTTPIGAVSTDVGIYVTYDGSQASATVTVEAAAGDITFKHGASGAEAVDSTIDSGGDDPGVIDMSDSNANSFGEVLDLINASANWSARLGGVKRADLTANTLITKAATQAKGVELSLLRDTTVLLTAASTVPVASAYVMGVRITRDNVLNGIKPADAGLENILVRIEGIGTSAGTIALGIWTSNVITKTDTLIWQAPITTATAFEFNDVDFGALGGVLSKPGESLLIQLQADTATITSPRLVITGLHKYLGASKAGLAATLSDV
jgi:hypothetical protein